MNGLFCGEGVLEGYMTIMGRISIKKRLLMQPGAIPQGRVFRYGKSGQFSNMSSANGKFFLQDVPTAGYPKELWVIHPSHILLINSGGRT